MALTDNPRVAGLDIMRTAAILPVVIGHGAPLLASTGGGFPWIPLPDGVDIFFVLSGFLIGQILFRIPKITAPAVLAFWGRRWARTLPNYYLFLGLNVLFSTL